MAAKGKVTCEPCRSAGRRGYCARGRCYCGHPACWAYDSWGRPEEIATVERGKRFNLKGGAA